MMKEDYLWNKTGSDAEIEKLENALKAFQFQAQEPPALPTKVTSSDEKRPFSFFKLGFAFAFAASVAVVAFAVAWFRIPADLNDEVTVNRPDESPVVELPLGPS